MKLCYSFRFASWVILYLDQNTIVTYLLALLKDEEISLLLLVHIDSICLGHQKHICYIFNQRQQNATWSLVKQCWCNVTLSGQGGLYLKIIFSKGTISAILGHTNTRFVHAVYCLVFCMCKELFSRCLSFGLVLIGQGGLLAGPISDDIMLVEEVLQQPLIHLILKTGV